MGEARKVAKNSNDREESLKQKKGDAAFLLTVGSSLLTVEVFYLQLELFCFFTHSFSFFAYNFSSFAYNWSFLAYSGQVRLIRALRDCKQRRLTVSKEAPTVSKKASPKRRWFGECTLVSGFWYQRSFFRNLVPVFGTVVPFFVPSFRFCGSREDPPNHPLQPACLANPRKKWLGDGAQVLLGPARGKPVQNEAPNHLKSATTPRRFYRTLQKVRSNPKRFYRTPFSPPKRFSKEPQ